MSKDLVVDGKKYRIQIWDTAGQEKYHSLAPMYYRGAAAAVIVYDITQKPSFQTLRNWVEELKKNGPANIIMAVAGNKCDLANLRVTFLLYLCLNLTLVFLYNCRLLTKLTPRHMQLASTHYTRKPQQKMTGMSYR